MKNGLFPFFPASFFLAQFLYKSCPISSVYLPQKNPSSIIIGSTLCQFRSFRLIYLSFLFTNGRSAFLSGKFDANLFLPGYLMDPFLTYNTVWSMVNLALTSNSDILHLASSEPT